MEHDGNLFNQKMSSMIKMMIRPEILSVKISSIYLKFSLQAFSGNNSGGGLTSSLQNVLNPNRPMDNATRNDSACQKEIMNPKCLSVSQKMI